MHKILLLALIAASSLVQADSSVWIGLAGQCDATALEQFRKDFGQVSTDECNDVCVKQEDKTTKRTVSRKCFAVPQDQAADLKDQISRIVTQITDPEAVEKFVKEAREAKSLADLGVKARSYGPIACKDANEALRIAVYEYSKARDSFSSLDKQVTCPAEFKAPAAWLSNGIR